MDNVEKTTRTIEEIKHNFYCDVCNKYLGSSTEYDDGYYVGFGDFELKFYIDGWYRFEKCLCDDCKNDFLGNLKETLKTFGFERD